MRERNYDIGTLLLHLRDPRFGGGNDVAHRNIAFQIGRIPNHDLGRREADDADFNWQLVSGAIGNHAIENEVGRNKCLITCRICGQRAIGNVCESKGEI